MARKLKDKLPRNFDKIAESGDFDAFKEVFTERALDAKKPSWQHCPPHAWST